MENSFLKWAGGKTWFVKHQAHRVPKQFNRYIDPFIGGGSLFFYLEPNEAIISDLNEELITTYQAIRDDWNGVQSRLRTHANQHDENYYYRVRDQRPRTPVTIAARMIYLNRTCFNGIYRVNASGKFNVPKGSKDTVLRGDEKFEERSIILNRAEINHCDFEVTIDRAEEGDFLFCDPPYAVREEQSFVLYTRNMFDWDDQIRLANALIRAKNRKVKIIMTNVNHPEVRALYVNEEGFVLDEVSRYCGIAGRGGKRQQYSELIVSANI